MAGGWSALEKSLRRSGATHIAGVDEVGRGPLAGPVVVCAIVMPADRRAIAGVTDSKQLTAADRERLAIRIRADAVALALGAASVREIARWNIYQATARAMGRAIARLDALLAARPGQQLRAASVDSPGGSPPGSLDEILVDGKPIATLGVPHRAIVGGDATCYSIGCASIVAKVVRDRLMATLATRYPAYAWERNSGYGTPAHIEALRLSGLTGHHRISFCRTALGSQLEL